MRIKKIPQIAKKVLKFIKFMVQLIYIVEGGITYGKENDVNCT